MSVEDDANDVTIRYYRGLAGVVEIGGNLLGTLDIPATEDGWGLTGEVQIGGDLVGTLDITSDVAGTGTEPAIVIGGDLTGRVSIGSDLEHHLEVQGDVNSTSAQSAISVGEDLTGQIRVYGSLNDNSEVDYDIEVTGTMSSTGAVTVDYDGYHSGDNWDSGAVVRVDDFDYEENDPDERIYEATCEKGDMNNDGITNAYDIDGFITAVGDMEEYGADYPGLLGSGIYHGDFTCDGYVNSYDIGGFIARIADPDTCVTCEGTECNNCGDGGGEGGGAPLEPAEVAALFEEYVAPVRLPLVIEIVADLVDYHADTPLGEFWEAVLAELE